MKLVTVAISSPSHTLRALRNILNDALYRGSLFLLANTVVTSAIGFVFWTLAAHRYSAPAVGVFSGVTSGITLLATIAALGLPITMTRHIAHAEDQRGLVFTAIMIIASAGTTMCLAALLLLTPHLPSGLHIQQRGGMVFLVTVLVVFTAVGGTLDAGLVATRSTRVLLVKNLVGSIVKVIAMLLLTTFRSSGLLISFGIGLVLATVLGGVALVGRIRGKWLGFRPSQVQWHYLSITSGNYLATVIGILPLTIVPIEVLAVRGPAQTARFSIAFLIAGFLNFIPSTMGQVLFAEISRGGAPLGKQFRKALRAVYGLLLPSLAFLLVTAPLVLRLFGQAYAIAATGCLRFLALSALPAGGTYLVDSLLVARDRTAAYTFMQIANAALILGCVGILLPYGLTAAAAGLAFAQGLSLILGLLVLATGRLGRHHTRVSSALAGKAPPYPQHDHQPSSFIYALEPQIRELLAVQPMMPTTLIAERIGWDKSIHVLLDLVTELRLAYAHPYQDMSHSRYRIGETAQCGLWFPPTEIPVGLGQTRSAQQLPVLTMITGYSRWLTALLIPSGHENDLFSGVWELLKILGAVPKVLMFDNDAAIGRSESSKVADNSAHFCRCTGAKIITDRSADLRTRDLMERAHAHLEGSFLPHRTFCSPMDFNTQLRDWLRMDNARKRQPPDVSPAELMNYDRQAMLPLPSTPPWIGWHISTNVRNYPFLRFDSNTYSVHPTAIDRRVELIADLNQIRVLCEGRLAALHERSWARGQMIQDPAHLTVTDTSAKIRKRPGVK
jgi:O-antigen/teichoic acid export membrane protein